MRVLCSFFLFSCFAVFQSAALFSQTGVQDIGVADRKGEGVLAIAFEGSDERLVNLGRRAFTLHGGFSLTRAESAAFVFRVEAAGANAVELKIQSGQPLQTLRTETIRGSDLQNALLRACDYAVRATLREPGFFAGKLAFVNRQRGVSEIYESDLLFSRVRAITSDRALVTGPSWSPDGSRLLYTTYFKNGFPDVYMINVRTGARQPIATFKGTNSGATFSPDGQQIAMVLSGTGNAELYVSDSQGRNLRRLTNNRSLEAAPSWSPDGRRIVFESDAPGRPQLFEIAASGGPMRRLPTDISRICSEPAWNPVDANKIAFTAAASGGFQIALYDMQARKSEFLTSVADAAVEPVWLNDGRHLIFTQRTGGRTSLMILDSKTKRVRPLHQPALGDPSSASFVY